MLTNTLSPKPRRKSAALEVMLSSLETAGDLLSGSECSSLAASPVREDVFSFGSHSPDLQDERDKQPYPRSPLLEPIEVLQTFLNGLSKPHAAKRYIAEDAKFECHSSIIPKAETSERIPRSAQGDLDDLLASCSRYTLEVDEIFACGEDVAAFGQLTHEIRPLGLPRNLCFSVWASVDVARAQILRFRWLDQIVQA